METGFSVTQDSQEFLRPNDFGFDVCADLTLEKSIDLSFLFPIKRRLTIFKVSEELLKVDMKLFRKVLLH